MFGFLMMGNYEDRKVGRNDFKWGFISTASVNDGAKPYETAVKHEQYNGGRMVIVENYDTKSQATAGHKKWVKTMTAKKLPSVLVDCCNSELSQVCEALGSKTEFKREPKKRRAA